MERDFYMNESMFFEQLRACKNKKDLALLTEKIIELLICKELKTHVVKSYISELLERGLDPSFVIYGNDVTESESTCIDNLVYAYDEKVLRIARLIFEKCGVPPKFYSYVGSRVDYNYYNEPYTVKLYLLASAYVWQMQETYIKMNENLYEEMFDDCYTTLRNDYNKLTLTPDIFKQIEKFDFLVEMLPQEAGASKRILHIFDRKSKIEVARYE